jgi:hypothetical protein
MTAAVWLWVARVWVAACLSAVLLVIIAAAVGRLYDWRERRRDVRYARQTEIPVRLSKIPARGTRLYDRATGTSRLDCDPIDPAAVQRITGVVLDELAVRRGDGR